MANVSAHIGLTEHKIDVSGIRAELLSRPELWNEIPLRTFHPRSPHREASDIWVRYNAFDNFKGLLHEFNAPHESVWYPAADHLPSVRAIVEQVQRIARADLLGGIFITKVPAGKCVYPHTDQGWHATFYDSKYAVQLLGNLEQAFCYDDGELSCQSGDVYWFTNTVPHWVRNDSDEDRITLIVTMKRSY